MKNQSNDHFIKDYVEIQEECIVLMVLALQLVELHQQASKYKGIIVDRCQHSDLMKRFYDMRSPSHLVSVVLLTTGTTTTFPTIVGCTLQK